MVNNDLPTYYTLLIERATRIELASIAWEAIVLPLYYARSGRFTLI